MNRFYAEVDTVAAATAFQVRLDGKPVHTPARQGLALPTERLARLVAQEWRAQGRLIEPVTMPVTRLATTVTDLMPARRADAIAEAVGFAATDLLCYRASEPLSLVRRQHGRWQPWLDWAADRYTASLRVTAGVEPIGQPGDALRALHDTVAGLDDWRLVGLHAATTLTGSLILGLAAEQDRIDAEALFTTAFLDELYGIERWGEDEEQRQRHAGLRRDLDAASWFLRALETAPADPGV